MAEHWQAERQNLDRLVKHRRIDIDGVEIFYREAGPADGPVLLLPHGYPSSSMEFRGLMAALSSSYRLLAPDFPGQGLSATPEDFDYSFRRLCAFARTVHRDAAGGAVRALSA